MKLKKIIFKNTESTLYYIGIFVAIIVIAVYLLLDIVIDKLDFPILKICVLRVLTGLYCPGCGGTRAAIALVHGNILSSIIYNPFVTYSCIIGGIFYITQTLSRLTHNRIKGLKFRKSYLYIGIILLIANFLIKNICLLLFGIRLIE